MGRTVDFLCFCCAISCHANMSGHLRYRGQTGVAHMWHMWSHICDLGNIRYESANYLNFHAQKKHQTILLAMRLVLVLLATFLQFPISFLNLQNLIGLYAFNNVRRRQMLAIKLLLYTDTGGGREEDEIDGWDIGVLVALLNFNPGAVYTRHLCSIAKIQIYFGISDLIGVETEKKLKKCFFKTIRQIMTCFEAGHRPHWS